MLVIIIAQVMATIEPTMHMTSSPVCTIQIISVMVLVIKFCVIRTEYTTNSESSVMRTYVL